MYTTEMWAAAKDIFLDAQELAPSLREAYSRARSADDPKLFEAVSSLFRADESSGRFLENPYASEAPILFKGGRSLIGETIGNYRCSSQIADGGLSSLYRGSRLDGLLHRDVGIKVHWTQPERIGPPKRFLTETTALASVDHQGICRLYDVIPLDSEAYCTILEWIDGLDIKVFCDRLRMPVRERVQLLLPVLDALQEIHSSGFVHGDIKEEHVLTTPQQKSKLIDFGAARKVTADTELSTVHDFTPEYASPEVLLGGCLDNRSDLYSFGILMYRLLLGRNPYNFRSGLLTDIADVVLNEDPQSAHAALTSVFGDEIAMLRATSIQRLRSIFTSDLEMIMLRAIQKERTDRYQTASDIAHDLRLWLANRPTVAGALRERMITMDPVLALPLNIFLCHCSEDKPRVRELAKQLRVLGVTTWLDEEDLLPGQEWREEIPKAVAGASVVVVCLSNHSLTKKGFVQKEIRFALDVADEQPPGHIFIIPVRLVDCDVPDRLKKWQWVNLFEEQGFGRLVKALRFHSEQGRNPTAL